MEIRCGFVDGLTDKLGFDMVLWDMETMSQEERNAGIESGY